MYTEQLQKYFMLAADILNEKKRVDCKKNSKNSLLSITYHQHWASSF